jgi:hypothetical protein
MIYEFLQVYFKPLADALKWFYDSVIKPLADALGGAMPQAAYATGESFEYVGAVVETSSVKLRTMADYLTEIEQKTVDTRGENLFYLESVGKLNMAVGISNERLEMLVENLQTTERKTRQALQADFDLVAEHYDLNYVLTLTNEEISLLADNLRVVEDYFRNAEKAASDFKEATKSDEEQGASGNTNSAFRMTGELPDAREKYAGLDLIKVGSNWRPKNLLIAQREKEAAATMLSNFKRRVGTPDSRSEVERLAELENNVTQASNRYAEEMINVQVVVNNNAGSTDVTTRVTDDRNRVLKSSRQVIATSG